jgi:hypothetical protein
MGEAYGEEIPCQSCFNFHGKCDFVVVGKFIEYLSIPIPQTDKIQPFSQIRSSPMFHVIKYTENSLFFRYFRKIFIFAKILFLCFYNNIRKCGEKIAEKKNYNEFFPFSVL